MNTTTRPPCDFLLGRGVLGGGLRSSQSRAKQIPHRDVRRRLSGASLRADAAGGDQRHGTPAMAGGRRHGGMSVEPSSMPGDPKGSSAPPLPLLSVSDATAHYKCPPRGISSVPRDHSRFSDLAPKAPWSGAAGVRGSRVAARSPPMRFQARLHSLFFKCA